jgi:hypothetical protein
MWMARFRIFTKAGSVWLLALSAAAAQIPVGTELHVRLKSKVASTSKPGEPVEAMLIVPVMENGRYVLPPGAIVSGEVAEALPAKPDDRATLTLDFSAIQSGGASAPLQSRVVKVDNARESVTEQGRIIGILASETLSARMDQGLERLAGRSAGLAGLLGAVKGAVVREADPEIVYEPGAELTIRLLEPANVAAAGTEPHLEPVAHEEDMVALVNRQPFQTTAQKPPKPSDITNLMFIGSQPQLEAAFKQAGWSSAHELNAQSAIETVRAVAELRGYKEAPMSILLLEGKAPDLVFQKQLNTFAMRHHLRVWRRPETFHGAPVWVSAATHDIGIDFSQQDLTFIHLIDPKIDRERAKVITDLVATGRARSVALVDRPAVPKESMNATGDKIETDGAMAVLILR